MPTFTDDTNHRLFGNEDAENESTERLKEYFYRNKAYDNMICGLPIRVIVGHKGVGKSALLKIAYLEDQASSNLAIWLRPNDIKGMATATDVEFNSLIEEWKYGIANEVFRKIIQFVGAEDKDRIDRKATGPINAIFHAVDTYLSKKQSEVHTDITKAIIAKYKQNRTIYIYLDDLDRGWEARPQDIKRISALLNAIRDMVGHSKNVQFRIGLRSDVYFLVRTSDESTDKIEQNIIWLTWSNHDILTLLAKRIETYYGNDFDENRVGQMRQTEVARYFDPIIETRFDGYGKWKDAPIHRILLSLIRRRPRDLIKLFYGAAREAYKHGHSIISTDDLRNTFENYSNERLQDVINEFRTELPGIGRLLYEMRPSKRERQASDNFLYSSGELIVKLNDIIGHTDLYFTNGADINPKSIAEFLFKIDFITARKDSDANIVRRYFEQSRHLQNQFVDFGFHWEIHPAYRWALQPGEDKDIFAQLDLSE